MARRAVRAEDRHSVAWQDFSCELQDPSRKGVGAYSTIATNLTQPMAVDTGLMMNESYFYVVSEMTGTSESGDSDEVGVIPRTVPFARNAGGTAAAPFTADTNFSGGTAASTTAFIDRALPLWYTCCVVWILYKYLQ
jgi:hypothetical protein